MNNASKIKRNGAGIRQVGNKSKRNLRKKWKQKGKLAILALGINKMSVDYVWWWNKKLANHLQQKNKNQWSGPDSKKPKHQRPPINNRSCESEQLITSASATLQLHHACTWINQPLSRSLEFARRSACVSVWVGHPSWYAQALSFWWCLHSLPAQHFTVIY